MILALALSFTLQTSLPTLDLPVNIGELVLKPYITSKVESESLTVKLAQRKSFQTALYRLSGLTFQEARDLLSKPLLLHGWKEDRSATWLPHLEDSTFKGPNGQTYGVNKFAESDTVFFFVQTPDRLLKPFSGKQFSTPLQWRIRLQNIHPSTPQGGG